MHLLPGLQRCRREERHRNAATDRRRLKLDVICEMLVVEEVPIDSKQAVAGAIRPAAGTYINMYRIEL